MKQFPLIAGAATMLLAGCINLQPDYKRPAPAVPADWPTGAAYRPVARDTRQTAIPDLGWDQFFIEPKLRKLIGLGLANNRDLRIAMLNVEKTRAQYRLQRAEQLPTINLEGKGDVERIPRRISSTGDAYTSHQYTAEVGISAYELDLFGRIQSLKDQALETYFSNVEAQRSAQITLVGEIASGYLTLAADMERLKLAQDTLASQQQSYDLTKRSFEIGNSSELDVRQAQTSVDSARVDIAAFTANVAQDQNALALLLGTAVPSDLLPEQSLMAVTAVQDIRAGIPSDVLQRRPDILEAEHVLKGANANIGAARAAFFPQITLTATSGRMSDALSTLFKAGTSGWAFIPDIVLPIFDWGQNQANLDAAKADRDIDVAQYDKAIQTAFKEVADALADYGTLDDKLSAEQSLVEATSESYRLSDARYRKGIENYLNVLDSQRSMYSAQQDLISVRLSKQSNLVTLYKVLGGGWSKSGS
ncbi:MAG TPA: efflux transporter outer membrane subunit [Terriglobia bacterium]|nr:efflux transporter outer membrane subunit [Terriglobia bacterium]